MHTLNLISRNLARTMYVIAGAALSISLFLTVADVLLRAAKKPIMGTYELVGVFGALAVSFAIPQTSRLKGQVAMDFVLNRLSDGIQLFLFRLTRLLAIFLFAILGWNLIQLGNDYRQVGEVTLTLQIPLYPIAYAIAACCFVECLVLFVSIFEGAEGTS